MVIIINKLTNKIARTSDIEIDYNVDLEYKIEREVDLACWSGYDIFFIPLRGTFEKGDPVYLQEKIQALQEEINILKGI